MYDLLNATVAPYVSTWVGERSMVSSLKKFQNMEITSTYTALKSLRRSGEMTEETFLSFTEIKCESKALKMRERPLQKTKVKTLTEFIRVYEKFK